MKWAVCDHFRDYLYYASEFTVYTDNNPLTYILSSAKLNATGLRWVGELSDFHFTIKYRPGKANTDADELSRLVPSVDNYIKSCTEEITIDTLQAVQSYVSEQQAGTINWVTAFTTNPKVLEDREHTESVPVNTISCDDIVLAQREDETINSMIKWIESKERPTPEQASRESHATRSLLHEWNKLELDKHGLLRRKTAVNNQIVLPKKLY